MSSEIGVGLPHFWQLPREHKFYAAALFHDAAHDAVDCFKKGTELYKFDDLEKYPEYYKTVVKEELRILTSIYETERDIERAIKRYVRFADKRFKEDCHKLARSKSNNSGKTKFLIFQENLYYALVNLYSFLKFR